MATSHRRGNDSRAGEPGLHELMHGETKWHDAFAFGAGCTLAQRGDGVYAAIREPDAYLRSIIAEHREGNR